MSNSRVAQRQLAKALIVPVQVRFSNRPFGVKRFQAIHHCSVDVAHGLVLLFGIGMGGLAVLGTADLKRTNELTSSIVPRGTSFHRVVELQCSPIVIDPERFSCRSCFLGPAKLGAVGPYAVHDHGEATCQRHDRLLHPAVPAVGAVFGLTPARHQSGALDLRKRAGTSTVAR